MGTLAGVQIRQSNNCCTGCEAGCLLGSQFALDCNLAELLITDKETSKLAAETALE